MANFKPLKNYLLYLLDKLVDKYSLEPPFLDVGCGIGDVSLYFAQRNWQGKAIDSSSTAVEKAKRNLVTFHGRIVVSQQSVLTENGKYKTVLLCDVLEHIPDDHAVVSHLASILEKGSKLIITVPTFAREWRRDDNFYGHIRRYEIDNLKILLQSNNLKVLKIWDFTFPIFWILRRIYTRFVFAHKGNLCSGSPDDLTLESSMHNAWKGSKLFLLLENILERLPFWNAVFYLNSFGKDRLMGCECLVLCEKL